MQIVALSNSVEEVGKYVSSSKKRFSWSFKIDRDVHNLVAVFSFVSGKVKIILDTQVILDMETNLDIAFQHTFNIGSVACTILMTSQCELRINNKVFSHLLANNKSKTEFVYAKQASHQFKDFTVKLPSEKQKIKVLFQKPVDKKGISKFLQFGQIAAMNSSAQTNNFGKQFSFQQFGSFQKSKPKQKLQKIDFGAFGQQFATKSSLHTPPPPAKEQKKPAKEIDLLGDLMGPNAMPIPQKGPNKAQFEDLFSFNSQTESKVSSKPKQINLLDLL